MKEEHTSSAAILDVRFSQYLGGGALMIAIANGESLLPDVEDWMDREVDVEAEDDGNFLALPQQAFRIRASRACSYTDTPLS